MERDLRGMTIAGRYRIERLLARGGMGTTYIALDERAFERRVVVKVPDTLRSDDARARFVNEARQIIGLQHPHIVTALDVGTVDDDDTTPFIAMAYMGGGDLAQRIAASGGVQSPEEVAAWLGDIAEALDLVHEHHVLHRDVKPGNILFDRPGPGGEPFLADFGIAKALEGEVMVHTHTGEHLGSPKYMPPETWFGTPGPAFDQYSLACVAYEALSGTLPHTADNALALAMEKNAKPPRPLTEVAPHVPAAAAAALMRGIEKDPAQRFRSCSELARAFAAGLTVPSIPVGESSGDQQGDRRASGDSAAGSRRDTDRQSPRTPDLQVRASAASLQWVRIVAVAGALCASTFAATAGTSMAGLGPASFVMASLLSYAMVMLAWSVPRLRLATLRSVSLFVGLTLGVFLIAFIFIDAARHLGAPQDGAVPGSNDLPIAFPIAVILAGTAFIISRTGKLNVRDGNALLAMQVPILGLCLWLAGLVSPSAPTPLTVLSGIGLLVAAFSVLFVAPRTAFLVDEELVATPVRWSFMAFSVAATLFGLAAPLIFFRTADSHTLSVELFFAAGVLPLTLFSAVQQRTGAFSPAGRGVAYGCAVLIATFIAGDCASTTLAITGVTTFGLSAETFQAALTICYVLPTAVLGSALIYWTSPRSPTRRALAPFVALHVSWITAAALTIPSAFSQLVFFSRPYSRMPGSLLLASAAASSAAIVSARIAARRGRTAAAVPPLNVSNVGARN
jgi:serine/threonine protein kinase